MRDFVQAQRRRGEVGAGVDVQSVLDVGDRDARGFGVDQRGIRAAGQQRMLAHPQQLRLELVGGLDWMRCRRDDVAAAGVDFIFKDQRDRMPRALLSPGSLAVTTISGTLLTTPDGVMRTVSPGLTDPLAMRPENPRKSRLGRFTHCTGMVKGSCDRLPARHRLEPLQQRRPLVPGHGGVARLDDVLTLERR